MADATCANLRMRDICCCQDEHNYDGIGVKSCRFGGKRLPMMYRYEPLKVCLNKKKLEFEEECPSICNKNVLLEVSKDKKQLEHEKKEADEEAFREQQESLKDSCLTQEQIKKQYHIEPVKECPQQNIEHLKKMCPLHSKLVNKNPLYPRIQKPPDDCPCRKHLFKEGREDLAYKDCEKILCKNPCEQEKMEKRQCKVECILPNICERPERRHEGLPKKGKWHDLPKCLWDYYDKSSPYWEQEEISQVNFFFHLNIQKSILLTKYLY